MHNVREWHTWFAWRPVVVDGKRVWLRRVERVSVRYRGFLFHSYANVGHIAWLRGLRGRQLL